MKKKMTKIHFLKSEELVEDEVYVTLKDTKGNVVLEGDYYHNKIEDKIDGFIEGLIYAGYKVDIINIG